MRVRVLGCGNCICSLMLGFFDHFRRVCLNSFFFEFTVTAMILRPDKRLKRSHVP
jgi:hypothetical protein